MLAVCFVSRCSQGAALQVCSGTEGAGELVIVIIIICKNWICIFLITLFISIFIFIDEFQICIVIIIIIYYIFNTKYSCFDSIIIIIIYYIFNIKRWYFDSIIFFLILNIHIIIPLLLFLFLLHYNIHLKKSGLQVFQIEYRFCVSCANFTVFSQITFKSEVVLWASVSSCWRILDGIIFLRHDHDFYHYYNYSTEWWSFNLFI